MSASSWVVFPCPYQVLHWKTGWKGLFFVTLNTYSPKRGLTAPTGPNGNSTIDTSPKQVLSLKLSFNSESKWQKFWFLEGSWEQWRVSGWDSFHFGLGWALFPAAHPQAVQAAPSELWLRQAQALQQPGETTAGWNPWKPWPDKLYTLHTAATRKQTQTLNPAEGKGARTHTGIFALQLLRLCH